ncbi:class I SAM-dependent methyltransferase [Ramlibacter henchirensis]|uniref:class I SAM-dependent methyltransferase n=1 Tax=Ramlibacter henchirensis TaxID=204072 RepID=UPI001F0F0919|nr:class I SAM-dependent methyltransferase [Ramlibacter henchirensis]
MLRRQLCLAAAACFAPAVPAQLVPAPGYEVVPRSADGIGKSFMGREIAGVMGWQGAAWLEREDRERQERSDLLLRELNLAPGLQVADIGAGTGYHARRIARLVAPGGTVHAVDVQPQMLEQLQARARREGIANIVPVLASERDSRLAPSSIDLALLVDVYHELEYPVEVMASVVRALRPGGRLVLVEYRGEDPKVPIKTLHKMSEAQVRREMAVHAVVYERTSDVLPWQHIVVFRRD